MKKTLLKNLNTQTASIALISVSLLAGCAHYQEKSQPKANTNQQAPQGLRKPSEAQAHAVKEFLEHAQKEIETLSQEAARIYWINANFITEDSDWLASKVGGEFASLAARLANEAKIFQGLKLDADTMRKLNGIRQGNSFPAPEKPGAAQKLSEIQTSLNSSYGKGKFTYQGKELTLGELSGIIASSRDPEELKAIWAGWRTVSPPMKKKYAQMVEIINEGARELGFADVGALWRAGYDMEANDFTHEAERLWGQVKPLYDELHCHVRGVLNEKYGDETVPLDKPIRADLLGNMWAQSWGNLYDLMIPNPQSPSLQVTQLLEKANYDDQKMVKTGEDFFSSLGFKPLPDTFWERSLFLRPKDREVVCHASAWNIDDQDDIRIKMCIKVDGEDFQTVHHELGHNYYQRAYKNQPIFYRTGAHDGFHEAIGDMIGLSITPNYLVKIGLLDKKDVPGAESDLNLLMAQALEKVAFLPFGLMVDQWRWKVFNKEYTPNEYNTGWWELREKYQGIRPPVKRAKTDFDPGAKYHIPGNTPYMRYFLAHILQFQFHKAACEMAGNEDALHRCSIYGNKTVGKRFNAMMELGASKPWQDALEAFTGTREMDGEALLEYFKPLRAYLQKQNKTRQCGW